MGNEFFISYPKMIFDTIGNYFDFLKTSPQYLVSLIIDLAIVGLLAYMIFKLIKGSRVMQVIKGILILIIATFLTDLFKLKILNLILSTIMNFGIIALIIIFQPELRRALEQLGSNKITKFFGMEKDIQTKTKEDIYKVVIASHELSNAKIGGLIVFQRDIELSDIIQSGIEVDSIISPQLIVNIFNPKTPLHDGAIVIAKNRIVASACILPLYDKPGIDKKYGTRHRAGLGISKESDAICVIISEETGNISVAKDGRLYENVKEEKLKQLLLDNLIAKTEDKPKNKKNKKDKKRKKEEKIVVEKIDETKVSNVKKIVENVEE